MSCFTPSITAILMNWARPIHVNRSMMLSFEPVHDLPQATRHQERPWRSVLVIAWCARMALATFKRAKSKIDQHNTQTITY
jgi:hypothetical protein